MATISSLTVDLKANTAAFESGMKKANTSLRGIEKNLGNLRSSFSTATKIAGVFGVTLGAGALISFTKRSLDAAGGLGEIAQQLGVSTKALQAYRYAATQAGATQQELDDGLARLTRSIGDAAEGNKAAIDAFNRLGVGVLDAGGKVRATEDVARDMADALKNMKDPAQQASAIVGVLGKAGQKLLPIFAVGSDSLDSFTASAQAAGVVLSDDMIAKADDAADKIAALDFRLQALAQTFAVTLAPGISKAIDTLNLWLEGLESADNKSLSRVKAELASVNDELERLDKQIAHDKAIPLVGESIAANLEPHRRELQLAAGALQARVDFLQGPPNPVEGASKPATHNPPAKTGGISDAERQAKAIQGVIDALNFQAQQLQRTEREQEIYNQLQRAGVSINSDAGKQIAALAGANFDFLERQKELNDEIEREDALQQDAIQVMRDIAGAAGQYAERLQKLHELLNDNLITQQQYNSAVALMGDDAGQSTDSMKDLSDASRDFGDVIGTEFEDAVLNGENLRDVLAGLEQGILRIGMRVLVTKPLENFFTNLLSGGGGGLDSAINSNIANNPDLFGSNAAASAGGSDFFASIGSFFGFASGGRPPMGMPSIVGENGPELFVPDVPGRIVPNGDSVGGGVTIVLQGVTDFNSFKRSEQQLRSGALQAARLATRND